MIQLKQDISRDDYPYLPRTLKKGEWVYEYKGHTNGRFPKWGHACLIDGHGPMVALPVSALELPEIPAFRRWRR